MATGGSQSAFGLTTYIDAVQPLVHEYNGFLVQSRGGSGAPLSQSPRLSPPDTVGGAISCAQPLNTGEEHYVVDAAEYALNRWVTIGIPPAWAPRLRVNAAGTGYVTDANGNVEGGIRTPAVQVPVATLSSLGNTGPAPAAAFVCSLVGSTAPFSAARLAALYPTHARFVAEWSAATEIDTLAGFIRPADAAQLIAAASASGVGG